MADDRSSTVEEHLDRVLDAIEPLPAYPQPLMDALGLAAAEDVVAPISLPPSTTRAMDGYAVAYVDVAARVRGRAGPPARRRGDRRRPGPAAGDVARHGRQDHDRRAGAGRRRRRRALRVDRPRRRPGPDHPVAPARASTSAARRGRHRGRPADRGGHRPRPAPPRPAGGRRPRHRPLPPAAPGGDPSTGSELREPGTPLGHDSIYDGNSCLLAASARRAGAIAYRVGIVPDEPRAFLDALNDQLVRADLVVTSGGVSQGDYDVVKEALSPLGTVWFGGVAMQPGKPQGFGFVGEDETPIFTLPGNPVSSYISFETFVLPAIRKMMGKAPLLAADHPGPAHPRHVARRRAGASSCAAATRSTAAARSCRRSAAHGSHLIGDLAAVQRADRRARGRHLGAGRRAGAACCARRGVLMADPDGRLTHVDDVRRGPDGRRVRQGRHRPHGVGVRAGCWSRPRWSGCCAARACRRATRSPSPGSPGSWAPSRPRR